MVLTDDGKKELEKSLALKENLDKKDLDFFYERLKDYINSRTNQEVFVNNLHNLVNTCNLLGFSKLNIIKMIMNEPPIIHSKSEDLINKYLILYCLVDPKTLKSNRNQVFINHTRDLRISTNLLYARVKYLQDNKDNNIGMRTSWITRKKVLKATNSEFFKSHGNSRYVTNKEELIKKYPFNEEVHNELLNLKENETIRKKLENI